MLRPVHLLVLLAMSNATIAFAQKPSSIPVPPEVAKAFSAKFPGITPAEWELEDANYEVSFKVNNTATSVVFDKTGKWLETESEIAVSKLPAAVSKSIAKQFPGFRIKEAGEADTFDCGKVYEVGVQKGKELWEVEVSASGNILMKRAEKEGADKDKD